MPKLAIIDQDVAAAGGENFTKGLITGLQSLPGIEDWEVTVLVRRRNSAGNEAHWERHVLADNFRLVYLRDDWLRRRFDKLSGAGRILGIKGTSKIQQSIPRLLRRFGTSPIKEIAGDVRLWVEPFCEAEKFDVVYFPFPYMVECPRISMPLVCTPHDFNYRKQDSMDPSDRRQMEQQVPQWLENCKALVVSTSVIAQELAELYPQFAGKARVIHTGIFHGTLPVTEADVSRFKSLHHLPAGFMLTAGWFLPHKNQKIVFEALGKLRQAGHAIPLVCTGPNSHQIKKGYSGWTSPYVQEVLEIAREYDLQPGVDFIGLGYLDKRDLECLYRLSRALLIPSLYEGGCLPMLEAMSAGCPVICSNIPTITELANLAGGNAWIFNPNQSQNLVETISDFLSNEEVVLQRTQAAAELTTRVFSWEKAAGEYLHIFKELIPKHF